MPDRTTRPKRFTIIELLIVISIIAILAAMLLPALARSKQLAKRAVCAGNLKQIGLTQILYASDNNRYVCLGSYTGTFQNNYWFSTASKGTGTFLPLYTAGLVSDPQLWYCPAQVSTYSTYDTAINPWDPGNANTRAGYSSRTTFAMADGATRVVDDWINGFSVDAPKIHLLAQQTIMSCVIAHSRSVGAAHGDGVSGLNTDGSVGWRPLALFEAPISTVFTPFSSSYNDAIDATWEGMDD